MLSLSVIRLAYIAQILLSISHWFRIIFLLINQIARAKFVIDCCFTHRFLKMRSISLIKEFAFNFYCIFEVFIIINQLLFLRKNRTSLFWNTARSIIFKCWDLLSFRKIILAEVPHFLMILVRFHIKWLRMVEIYFALFKKICQVFACRVVQHRLFFW